MVSSGSLGETPPQDELEIGPVRDEEVEAVIALWTSAGLTRPWNDPRTDIAFARTGPASDVLVGRRGAEIVASVMVGHDGHRGAVYYVAVAPHLKAQGLGRAIMAAAEAWLVERGVWKLNLLVRRDNLAAETFYERLGFERAETVQWQRWIGPGRG